MDARLLARQLAPLVLFLAAATLFVVMLNQTHWDWASAGQSPYPPPGPPPIPTPKPLPTISPNLSIAEGARQFVSQRHGIPKERLVLADVFTTTLPLTRRSLWQGLFGDAQSAKPAIYEVLVDESRRTIITDSREDPQTYWRAEETAFRQRYQERILGLIAERERSSPNDLRIDNGILRHYPLTGRVVWLGKISGAKAQVGIDTQKIELVEIKSLEEAESKARSDKYGKLHRDLFYFLQAKPPEQKVRVLLWISSVDEEWVSQELARRYPQIKAYRFSSGTPVDQRGSPIRIDEALFDQVRADYNRLLTQAQRQSTAPVQTFLETRGHSVRVADAVPCVEAELPISVILELNRAALPGLAAIYFGDIQVRPQLDSVVRTIRATQVWNAGYTGQGVRVAVMEGPGNLNTNTTHHALRGKIVASNFTGASDRHAHLLGFKPRR